MKSKTPVSRNYLASALTFFALGLVVMLLFDRYQFLKTKRDLHVFFEHGLDSFQGISTYGMGSENHITEKEKEGIEISKVYPLGVPYQISQLPKNVTNEYVSQLFDDSKIALQGYGQVVHDYVPAKPSIAQPTRVWFLVRPGPSRAEVVIHVATEADGVHRYKIASQPYHITNGVHSVGYLYSDTNGVKVGDTPLVGIKP
ncbi:hypothetical protein K8I31_02810 [bacterium]|nr:hypothetical protein [bacterium]